MAERSEAVEEQAVRDGSAAYSVEPEIGTAEDVPPGYKRTEVGVIPSDWEVESLGEYVTISSGESPSLLVFSSDGFPYFKVEQLGNSEKYLVAESTPYHFSEGKTVTSGSLIFAKRGAAIALNKIRLLGTASFMDTNLMALTPNENLEREYLYYQLGYIGLWRFADTTSVPQINNKHVEPLPFPLPRKEEQRAIATALSDADALIESLDRLIAKKRAIKQAAMQQLLTGQTRLPGFTGEWETKRLGDLLDRVMGGGTPSRSNPSFWNGDIPWVTVKDFASFNSSASQEYVTIEGLANSATNLISAGTVITSTRMALGKAVIYDVDVTINQDLKALFCGKGLSSLYLYFWFENHSELIEGLGSGSTVKGLSTSDLKSIQFLCASREEQAAITTVLSDMDTEIEALERRRDKARQIKQGMMQQLLTGRVRLVAPQATEPVEC